MSLRADDKTSQNHRIEQMLKERSGKEFKITQMHFSLHFKGTVTISEGKFAKAGHTPIQVPFEQVEF